MTFAEVALLGLYIAGWLFTYRHAYARAELAVSKDMGDDLGDVDRATMAGVCMVLCFGWPLVLIGYGVWRFLTPVSTGSKTGSKPENKSEERS